MITIPDEPTERRIRIWGNFRCSSCDRRLPSIWVESYDTWRTEAVRARCPDCTANPKQETPDA